MNHKLQINEDKILLYFLVCKPHMYRMGRALLIVLCNKTPSVIMGSGSAFSAQQRVVEVFCICRERFYMYIITGFFFY